MPKRGLLHPLPLSAVAVLVVNDHVLKHATWAPGALTGKLSDFAGLFFFPVLLVELARRLGLRARPVACAFATAVVFAAIKIEPRANALAAALLGACAPDPTDLLALPMTALAALWMSRDAADEGPRWARTLAMVAASLASVATSRAYLPPCPAVPKSEAHRSWDTLCVRTPGATVTADGAEVSVTFEVTEAAPGCVLSSKGLAIDQRPRPEISARTIAPVLASPLDQLSRIQVRTKLPYPADCATLSLGLLVEGAIVDLPILACGKTS